MWIYIGNIIISIIIIHFRYPNIILSVDDQAKENAKLCRADTLSRYILFETELSEIIRKIVYDDNLQPYPSKIEVIYTWH